SSIGAVASLFDISCLDHTPKFSTIQTTDSTAGACACQCPVDRDWGLRRREPYFLRFHHFVPSPSGTGLSPKWDLTSTGKFAGNFTVIGAKIGNIAAPTDPATNIDWLELDRVQGDLATVTFRIDTVGGQPPLR
ncbi:hypothetical protein B0H13DRAFT_1675466, partial [Mycena leptocephala]